MNVRKSALLGLVALAGSATWLIAGPLTPPAGPVTGTYKTLSDVEPSIAINAINTPGDVDSVYRITQSGSYYLVGNMVGEAGKYCIEVAADNVTIDLRGFAIQGNAASIGGIYGDGVRRNVTIRNGTVRGVGSGSGITFSLSNSRWWRVEGVVAIENSSTGIRVPNSSTVEHCRAAQNGGAGIHTSSSCIVLNCVSEVNQGDGVRLSSFCTVEGTNASLNSGAGFNGQGDGVAIIGCTSSSNTGAGISVLNGARVVGCVVRHSGGDGIVVSTSGIVEGNTVTFSGGNGISVHSNCIVRANALSSNGQTIEGAGILMVGSRNRVEENSSNQNDVGYRATASFNFIVSNVAGGNSTLNWDIASGNRCLVVQSVSTGAFSGNTGGTSPGSTDPNANFSN